MFGDSVEVRVLADPERASHMVQIQRQIGTSGAWTTVRTDTRRRSTPTSTTCRGSGGTPRSVPGHPRRAGRHPGGQRGPYGNADRAAAAGQQCDGRRRAPSPRSAARADWDPACATTHLTFDTADGLWRATLTLPAGELRWKVAINDSWTSTTAPAALRGLNITFTVPAGGARVTFVWDQMTQIATAYGQLMPAPLPHVSRLKTASEGPRRP